MAKHILYSSDSPKAGNMHYYHLPKGVVNLQLVKQEFQGKEQVIFRTSERTLPDPDHVYYLQYQPNFSSKDQLNVQFHSSGFLKHLSTYKEFSNSDVDGGGPAFANQTSRSVGGPNQNAMGFGNETILYETLFDPFAAGAVEKLNQTLEKILPGTKIEWDDLGQNQTFVQSEGAKAGEKPGIFCRPLVPFALNTTVNKIEGRRMLYLPHPGRTHFIEVPAVTGANSKLEIRFDDLGFPTEINLDKGSAALAWANAPLKAVKSLIGVVNEVFQVRIDWNNKSTQMLENDLKYAQTVAKVESYELEQRAKKEAERAARAEREAQEKEAALAKSQALAMSLEKENAFIEERSFPGTDELQKYDVQLQVIRYSSSDNSTLGNLFNVTNGRKFLAYTLEDEFRTEKEFGKTRIPAGTYEIKLRKEGGFHDKYKNKAGIKSMHKGMLHVTNVPNFTFILIHIGNDDDDTHGCLLVADEAVQNVNKPGRINSSTSAYKRIYPPIANALDAGQTVGIQYVDYDSI